MKKKQEVYKFNIGNAIPVHESEVAELAPGTYDVEINGKIMPDNIQIKLGGVYTLMVHLSSNTDVPTSHMVTVTPPNSLHMLWLIPQYIIMTMAEVMFSVTGLSFAFTQAPVSMKSLLQAGWLMTVAFGNLIVVIVAEAKFFDRQVNEFLLFAGLMTIDMIIFGVIAYYYKYADLSDDISEDDNNNGDDGGHDDNNRNIPMNSNVTRESERF